MLINNFYRDSLSGPFPPDDLGEGIPRGEAGEGGGLPTHGVGVVEELLDPGPHDHLHGEYYQMIPVQIEEYFHVF